MFTLFNTHRQKMAMRKSCTRIQGDITKLNKAFSAVKEMCADDRDLSSLYSDIMYTLDQLENRRLQIESALQENRFNDIDMLVSSIRYLRQQLQATYSVFCEKFEAAGTTS